MYDENGTGPGAQYLLGNAPHKETADAAAPVGREHDQVVPQFFRMFYDAASHVPLGYFVYVAVNLNAFGRQSHLYFVKVSPGFFGVTEVPFTVDGTGSIPFDHVKQRYARAAGLRQANRRRQDRLRQAGAVERYEQI